VFAVLEVTFLTPRQRLAEGVRDGPAQLGRCLEGEKLNTIATACPRSITWVWACRLRCHGFLHFMDPLIK
jgi:hypothetical protein